MPFVTTQPLEDMVNPLAVSRCARRIADAGGDRLQTNVRRNTPIDTSPFREKPGRPRGTARASVQRGRVERRGGLEAASMTAALTANPVYRVVVFSDDPIFPYIEWDTRPHEIRPRRPGGVLRWRGPGGYRFARVVHHPGTRGQHPFALGSLKTEAELHEIAAGPLRDFEKELVWL